MIYISIYILYIIIYSRIIYYYDTHTNQSQVKICKSDFFNSSFEPDARRHGDWFSRDKILVLSFYFS